MIGYLEQLNQIGWGTVLIVVALLIMALPAVGESISKFVSYFGIETKWSMKAKKQEDRMDKLSEGMEELKNSIRTLTSNLSDLDKKVREFDGKIDDMENKRNEKKRAELKDRIGQVYRYHNSTKK